ncbi:MAG TPA: anthranilate phosphoribosyltransferase [Pirellulales bacterium]|nr:anthranilate phosphoribosyltransferase [Pirellulales bacterium]
MLTETLGRLAAGENLSQSEATAVFDAVMEGHVPEEQIALLLTALRAKGETVDEIAGAAASLRKQMTPIRTRHSIVIDTCGTGGGGSKLFNISTAAALVTAATGTPVAKHGNRAVTSRTGSADVLAALGVNIAAEVTCVERCLNELGICFCFAPLVHPSMKRVAEVRRRLGMPTIFNLLGPLCNPAGAPFQLLGVGRPESRPVMAQALAKLGTKHAVVVSGGEGLGEVNIAGPTEATEVMADGSIREFQWIPSLFGLPTADSLDSLVVKNAEQSAEMIREVLAGKPGPARDIVIANSAAATWIAGSETTLQTAASRAKMIIDNGAASRTLANLVAMTNATR